MDESAVRKMLKDLTDQPDWEGPPGEIVVRQTITLNTRHFDGQAISTYIGSDSSGGDCGPAFVLDLGSMAQTDASGEKTLKLDDYFCDTPDTNPISLARPVIFVCSVSGDTPAVLTSTTEFVQGDLGVKVRSWGLDGSPQGRVSFHWRCFVRGYIPSII